MKTKRCVHLAVLVKTDVVPSIVFVVQNIVTIKQKVPVKVRVFCSLLVPVVQLQIAFLDTSELQEHLQKTYSRYKCVAEHEDRT